MCPSAWGTPGSSSSGFCLKGLLWPGGSSSVVPAAASPSACSHPHGLVVGVGLEEEQECAAAAAGPPPPPSSCSPLTPASCCRAGLRAMKPDKWRKSALSRNIELEAIYFGRTPSPPSSSLLSPHSSPSPPPPSSSLSSRSSLMRLLDNDPCSLFLIRHSQQGRSCLHLSFPRPLVSFPLFFFLRLLFYSFCPFLLFTKQAAPSR